MTREEAIKYLNEFIFFKKISNTTEREAVECFKLAVEALQEHQHYKDLAESYEKTINKLTKAIAEEQQKTGRWIGADGTTVYVNSEGNVTESRDKGEAVKCSECGEWLVGSDEYVCGGRFCPSCGIKMEEKK